MAVPSGGLEKSGASLTTASCSSRRDGAADADASVTSALITCASALGAYAAAVRPKFNDSERTAVLRSAFGWPYSGSAGAEADESACKRQEHNADVTEFAELPGRGHSLTIDGGRAEVARTALDFIKRFT